MDEYYNPKDLTTFQQRFNLPVQAVAHEQGPNDPNRPGAEAELDIRKKNECFIFFPLG